MKVNSALSFKIPNLTFRALLANVKSVSPIWYESNAIGEVLNTIHSMDIMSGWEWKVKYSENIHVYDSFSDTLILHLSEQKMISIELLGE